MTAVAGKAFFKINGTQYWLRGNFNCSLGNQERESVVGLDQYHGTIDKPRASFIEADLTDDPGVDLNTVETLANVTITVELINGKSGVLSNASQMLPISLNVADGTYKVRFEGAQGQWFS
jgi:hypothetical protein